MSNESANEDQSPPKTKRRQLWKWPLLVIPYLVGLAWHGIHPFVSVFTGRLEPRKWYIDENSLDPYHFQGMNARYSLVSTGTRNQSSASSLCQALESKQDRLSCYAIGCQLEVARILPSSGAVAPVMEAIVVVVPPPPPPANDWYESQLHYSILQLLHRLSTPSLAPWLSKSILVVTSTDGDRSTQEVVDQFLDVSFESALVRNLVAIDSGTADSAAELRILPQGRRGVLPNMDLVYLFTTVFSRAAFLRQGVKLRVHPHQKHVEKWLEWIVSRCPSVTKHKDKIRKLLEFLSFETVLALGPAPPHAAALDHGIDSITLQPVLTDSRQYAQLVSRLEPILRALSNLHERLHHSTALYLLLDSEFFVKHEEYLVPNLLLLIPLVVRAVTLILMELDRFDLASAGNAVWTTLAGATTAYCLWSITEGFWHHMPAVSAYIVILLLRIRLSTQCHQTMQAMACLLAIYIHVPIAFGHVSLAFPSALFWSPTIAFLGISKRKLARDPPTMASRVAGLVTLVSKCSFLIATAPFTALVPMLFAGYTPYVRYAYLPLHLIATMIWLDL